MNTEKRSEKTVTYLDETTKRYIESCARIRGIHVSSFIARLLATVAKDDLTASILDDSEELGRRWKYEHLARLYDKTKLIK